MDITQQPARLARPWAARAAAVVAVIALAAAYLVASRAAKRAFPDPTPVDALAARLNAAGVPARVVARPGEHDPAYGYLTTDPAATWETLGWEGVVWVRLLRPGVDPQPMLRAWGGRGRLAGGWLVFGDPELAGQIADALAD